MKKQTQEPTPTSDFYELQYGEFTAVMATDDYNYFPEDDDDIEEDEADLDDEEVHIL